MKELDAYFAAIEGRGYSEAAAPAFLAAWEALEAAFFGRLEAETADLADWRERFRVGATVTVELVETHRREAYFFAVEALAAGMLGAVRQRTMSARLTALVDSAREELEDPGSVPPATAGWIVGIFFARIYGRCTGAGGPDLRTQLPELLFLGISAYFGTEAGLGELI